MELILALAVEREGVRRLDGDEFVHYQREHHSNIYSDSSESLKMRRVVSLYNSKQFLRPLRRRPPDRFCAGKRSRRGCDAMLPPRGERGCGENGPRFSQEPAVSKWARRGADRGVFDRGTGDWGRRVRVTRICSFSFRALNRSERAWHKPKRRRIPSAFWALFSSPTRSVSRYPQDRSQCRPRDLGLA